LLSVNTNHLYNPTYSSSCIFVFLVWTIIVAVCTYVLMDYYTQCEMEGVGF